MSTRAAIAMRLPDNTIHAIYCHNDGYPGWVGAILGGWYTEPEKVKALIALGALSQLGPKLEPEAGQPHTLLKPQKDVTVAYHRDNHEPLEPGKHYVRLEAYEKDAPTSFDADYLYLYENGVWSYRPARRKSEWTTLKVVLEGQN